LVYSNNEYTILAFRSSYLKSNSYVVEVGQTVFVVDTGFNDEDLLEYLTEKHKSVAAVFLTHAHFDHAGTANAIAKKFSTPVFLMESDERILKQNNFLLKALGQPPDFVMPKCEYVQDGFVFSGFQFHSCPGHTPGSAFITFRNVVFTGDSVYADGISLVSLPGENESALQASLNRHKNLLLQSTSVFPGHGSFCSGPDLFEKNKQLISFLQRAI
jgi:glyoxylase-like metal-dependent hydrolase (beta-lactamase superfamily II)